MLGVLEQFWGADPGSCSDLASSHGARILTSRSSSVVRITGIGLRMDRLDHRVGAVVKRLTARNSALIAAWLVVIE